MTRRTWLLIAALWAFGSLNLFHPLFFSCRLGDIGDGLLNQYWLEHQYRVITDPHYPGSYATAPFWHPDSQNNMARSDLLTGGQPFYFLPRLILSTDNAYSAFFILAATANFAAFLWLARSFGVGWPAAALAAWVFAFGMHKVQHFVHGQFFVQCWGALGLACLIHFLEAPGRRWLFVSVLLLGCQTLTSPYSGVFYCLGASALVVVYLTSRRPLIRGLFLWFRDNWRDALLAVVAALTPTIVLLYPYWANRGAFERQPWSIVASVLPPPSHWIDPMQGTLWWFVKGALGGRIAPHEVHFVGLTFWLLALLAALAFLFSRSFRAHPRAGLAFGCFAMALSLVVLVTPFGPGRSAWSLVHQFLPGGNGIRDPRRVSMVANFGLLLAGALFLDYLLGRLRPRAARLLLMACFALALAENLVVFGLLPAEMLRAWDASRRFQYIDRLSVMSCYPRDKYAAYTKDMREMLSDATSAYVYSHPEVWDVTHDNLVQLMGQQMNLPVVNGISASYPPGYSKYMRPREVLAKGTHFELGGFAYLVPLPLEQAMRDELRHAGLSFVKRGNYFARYEPYRAEARRDVDFQIVSPLPARLRAGESAVLLTFVTNRGDYPWQPFGLYPTSPSYRVLDAATGKFLTDGRRAGLNQVLFPGETALVPLTVAAPNQTGSYIISLAVVQERVAWYWPSTPAREVRFPLEVIP